MYKVKGVSGKLNEKKHGKEIKIKNEEKDAERT